MAIQYAHSEDYDLSILQLKSALSDNPHFVKGYLLLALLYIGTDNYEKARVTLRRVLKIDKANSLAVHYLREMGDTEENIIEMRKQNVDNDGLLDDDYLEEIVVTEDGRAPKKIDSLDRSALQNTLGCICCLGWCLASFFSAFSFCLDRKRSCG